MRPPRLTSRLAAKQGIRQVEAHARADAFAGRVDAAFARAWRDVLAVLRGLPARGPAVLGPADRKRVDGAFRGVFTAVNTIFPESLKSLTAWGHRSAREALAEELPEKVAVAAVARDVGESRLTEDVSGSISRFLFPAPTPDEVDALVYAGDWRARLAAGTKLADPGLLASILSAGLIAGKNHRDIARDLLPHVDGVRSSARRVARTEALRVAAATQMRCHDQLGDLVIGYQIHATLDQHTRPEHAARSGTVYYASPGPGQKGYAEMPQPPHEADGSVAWNCRCWLTPVLRPLGTDGASLVPAGTPDPLVYAEWFDRADEYRRRVAVGTRRFSLLSDLLGRPPRWSDFLDPETGSLLSQAELAAETPVQRGERTAKVRADLAHRRALARQTSALGFVGEM